MSKKQIEEAIFNLEIALSTGSSSVAIDGRNVSYNSVGERKYSLEYFRNKLRHLEGKGPVRKAIRRVRFN